MSGDGGFQVDSPGVTSMLEKLATEEERKRAVEYADIIKHFLYYQTHSEGIVRRLVRDMEGMPPALRVLVPGFTAKVKKIMAAIEVNQHFVRSITDEMEAYACEAYSSGTFDYEPLITSGRPVSERESGKVRSILKQCMRDWSAEGSLERQQCYSPILDELALLYPVVVDRKDVKIVVPGCGLTRLPWEIARMGFQAEGNEVSVYMLLTSHRIINLKPAQHSLTLHPFITEAKNLWKADDQLQSVTLPDVDVKALPSSATLCTEPGEFLAVYQAKPAQSCDCVATCFFIDTAHIVLEYVRCIARLLKVGGYWLNFGPLLYNFADSPYEISIELSYEQLKSTFAAFGLEIITERKHLPALYTAHSSSMMTSEYDCVFFVCKKTHNTPLTE